MSTASSHGEIVVGLDIGTTKVCAVVGEVAEDGITILGVGTVPCRGLRKGIVSNIDWTVRSIKDAIESAQTMAGVEIRTIYAGIGGRHRRSSACAGGAAVAGVPLGVKVTPVTPATSCVQNVIRCAERCGLTVADAVLQPLASADAVLSD